MNDKLLPFHVDLHVCRLFVMCTKMKMYLKSALTIE